VTLSVDLLDPFASPWRPPKDLSDGVPRQAPIPAQQAFVAVDTLEVTASIESAGATPASFNETIEALEKKLIEAALEHCRGHQKKAAEHLGLSYHQMRGLLRKYGYGRDGADETPAIAAEKAK
jgi:psp operon transcriptional activator